jgi:beta-lactamase superfamily II metal-dependent hydrolase
VSITDLLARLETLDTKASDLGRPGKGGIGDRRPQLCTEWSELAKWVEAHEVARTSPRVQRLLGKTARELGEFRSAARHYALAVAPEEAKGAAGARFDDAAPVDLQQAANCLARAAQRDARAARADGTTLAPELRADFDRAGELAMEAIAMSPNRESHGVLGSALKKLASVTDRERDGLARGALQVYRAGQRAAGRDEWGTQNALQLALVVGGDDEAEAREAIAARRAPTGSAGTGPPRGHAHEPATPPSRRRVDQRILVPQDFWRAADRGDRLLTDLLASGPDERVAIAAAMVDEYERAFEGRSTYSERGSVIDHLEDLADLLPAQDPRREALRSALARLRVWQEEHVDPVDRATPDTSPAPPTARAAETAVTVTVTALPAGSGDCLVLEYRGAGEVHRLLVDGGLGAAYDSGLGAYLQRDGAPFTVDAAVVTHVDLDHIQGVIKALASSHLETPDVWFNGLDEIQATLGTPGTRGPRQGDELSDLLPGEKRNRCVNGSALCVPDDGPLPVVTLPGGARCTVLSPSLSRLVKLEAKWPPPSRGDGSLEELCERLEADTETERGTGFGGDRSVTNGSSIALLFEVDGVAVLLTGDAFASDLEAALKRLLRERGLPRLAVDLFKLSHHGSRNNVTDALLGVISPAQILVCTDGSGHEHPDEAALDMVRRHYPTVPIVFTDDTSTIRERAAHVGTKPPAHTPVTITL